MDKDKIHDTSMEELEKTTDLLRSFEPRISKEKKIGPVEDLLKEDSVQVENTPLENQVVESIVAPSPVTDVQEHLQKEDIVVPESTVISPIEVEAWDQKMDTSYLYSKEMKQKRYAKILIIVSLFLIPGLGSALVVSSHSNLLITETLEGIALIALGISIALFTSGVILYFKRKNYETIRPKKRWVKNLYSLFMGFYVVGCLAILFLLYGPDKSFKDWLVTTAMATMNHQHYCKWFYSDSDIADVFSRNYIKETGDSTDDSLIDTDIKEPEEVPVVYENEYEQAILERDPGTLYKIINFEVNGCNAYLAAIYDPSKVRVTTTNKVGEYGQYVTQMAKRENALVAINGAGFYDPGHNSSGGKPRGITIVNGKVVTNNEYKAVTTGGIIGFTKENKLVLLKNTTAEQALEMGVRDAVSWGPFLIVNGVSAYTSGNGGWGYAARTAIGQRADGIVLFLVVDSNANRSKGANMVDLTKIMENYGAINAANLDGGTSSVMAVNGELINDPIDSTLSHRTRPIATAFIVTE